MGGAVNATLRQIGAALGIAVVVALLGEPATPAAIGAAFDRAFTFVAVAGLAAGVLMWALYKPPIARVAEGASPSTQVPIH